MTSPKLRFKKDDGSEFPDWKFSSLGELVDIERGGSPRPIDKFITTDADGLNWIKIGDAPIEGNRIVSVKQKIKPEGLPKTRQVSKGDLILSNSMSFGRPYLLEVDGCIHDGCLAIRNIKNVFDITYLLYALSSETIRKQYKSLAGAGVVTNLNKDLVQQVVVSIPHLKEQQKIAEFFTALDEKIYLSQLKLDLFEKLKSGVMQKLFSQEFRFKKKDGSPFEPWESFTVGDLAQVVGGGTPSTLNPDYWDGDIYWLTPTEINSKYVHASNRKITLNGLNNSSAKLLPKRAILLTTRATLGACSINNQDNPVCTNQGFQSLVCKNFVDNEFLYYVITEKAFQKSMIKNASGSTFQEISSKNLKSISVHLPSIDEQRQIVLLLSTIDQKIDCVKRSLKVLKAQKTAFMQQMFV